MNRKSLKKTNIKGTKERPRLSLFRSNANIFLQLIDDESMTTLAAASSLGKKLGKSEVLKVVGKELSDKAKAINISKVVFDRGRYSYKGRVKAIADICRENGLVF